MRAGPIQLLHGFLAAVLVVAALCGALLVDRAGPVAGVAAPAGLAPLPLGDVAPRALALTGTSDDAWAIASYDGGVYGRRLAPGSRWSRLDVGEQVGGRATAAVDLDRDGTDELLVPGTEAVVVLGPGARLQLSQALASCVEHLSMLVDGVPSIVCRRGVGWEAATWTAKDGPGTPRPAPMRLERVLQVPQSVAYADVDGDGTTDVVSHQRRGRLEVQLAREATPRSVALRELPAPAGAGGVALEGTTGDVNGDGVEDVAFHARGGSEEGAILGTWVLLGRRDGRLPSPLQVDRSRLAAGAAPLLADLDVDGSDELVLVGTPTTEGRAPRRSLRVYALGGSGWDRVANHALPGGSDHRAAAGLVSRRGERGVAVAIVDDPRRDGHAPARSGLAVIGFDELRGERRAR